MKLQERLDELTQQRDQAKDFFLKCQGAIEIVEQMIKEDEEAKNGQEKKDVSKKVKSKA